jgi:hypothetical protein
MKYVLAMLVLVHEFSFAQIHLPELSPQAVLTERWGTLHSSFITAGQQRGNEK